MLQLKRKLSLWIRVLFIALVLFLNMNHTKVMSMPNNYPHDVALENHLNEINDKTWAISYRKQQLFINISSINSVENRPTYDILRNRYQKLVLLIKNLEKQRKIVYQMQNNRQNIIFLMSTPNLLQDLLQQDNRQLQELEQLMIQFNQMNQNLN